MIASHSAVFARKPFSSPLSEDDVARDDELTARLFGTETFASGITRAIVRPTLGGVRGVADLRALKEREKGLLKRWDGRSSIYSGTENSMRFERLVSGGE
jgi:hypothetical protein